MLFKSYAIATLVASVMAQPLGHQHRHHNEERDVAVVTKTNVVVVTAGSGSEVTSSAVEVSTSPVETASASSPTTAEDTSSASGSSTSSTSTSESSGSSSGGNGITYTPYSNDGGCKSSSQISSEVGKLSSYDIIRLYGTDCNQVAAVLLAKGSSQKLFLGVSDVSDIAGGVKTISSAVNGNWDDIYTVSIGNELVNSGLATPSQVKQYVQSGKSALKAAGYTGPVVSVDTFIAILENKELCDYSDYAAINAHAFFDGGIKAANAGSWVLEQIESVGSTCSGKKVLVTESGWPTKGETNGVAVPSEANQKSAVSSIVDTCGNDVILFTAYNDLWKADGAYNAEKYWGIYSS
ncbi:uncharacterized protein PRCAT00004888001 [Priceomyces carsonii]|uniref:uncharacterized protein n=1 Tax=Priceomyces carsonii TaxID=28549 RepID=UPI002ED80EC8|nr:unnamed protein product [Priceomyces carsonii]